MRMVVLRRMSDAILVMSNVVVMMCCWSLGKNMSRSVSVSVGGLGILVVMMEDGLCNVVMIFYQ